jgi:hypothetical protein
MTLGVGLLQGPKGGVFLMSEVPLYAQKKRPSCSSLTILLLYRGTSLTRKCNSLGPYRRPMPRVLGGS